MTPEKNILKPVGVEFDKPIIIETPSPVHTPTSKRIPPTIQGQLLPLPTHTNEPTIEPNYISVPNNSTTSPTHSNSPIPNKTTVSNEATTNSPKTPPIQTQADDASIDFHD